jgi:hypothetical protein
MCVKRTCTANVAPPSQRSTNTNTRGWIGTHSLCRPTKKIARAPEEARAKPSPYEERRRGHRDPRIAGIVIGFAPALAAPASEDVGRTVETPPAL